LFPDKAAAMKSSHENAPQSTTTRQGQEGGRKREERSILDASEIGVENETLVLFLTGWGHHSRLLVLANALLKEICFAL